MKTITAKYKGKKIVELSEDVELPLDTKMLVIIPDNDDQLKKQFQIASEKSFYKIWNNEEDEVWNDYL